jgi:hypothetical protein
MVCLFDGRRGAGVGRAAARFFARSDSASCRSEAKGVNVMVRAMAVGVTIILMQSAFAAEVSAKPVQWKKSEGGNNHLYEAVLVPTGINWVEAHLQVTARGCGWHLATITSQAEDEFVFGLISNNEDFFVIEADPIHGPWLGGFQRNANDEPSDQWRWVTTEEFEFTNWGDGEPNNTFGGPFEIAPGIPGGNAEDFLHYKRVFDGLENVAIWNDIPGNVLLAGYLAELEVPRRGFCSR